MLGLPGAPGCFQVQPSAELTSQVLPKAPKIPNTKDLVAQGRNINNVVESSRKYKGLWGFWPQIFELWAKLFNECE